MIVARVGGWLAGLMGRWWNEWMIHAVDRCDNELSSIGSMARWWGGGWMVGSMSRCVIGVCSCQRIARAIHGVVLVRRIIGRRVGAWLIEIGLMADWIDR